MTCYLYHQDQDQDTNNLTKKKGNVTNVSFLDMDSILREVRFFARDGVHLNDAGNERMGRRLREWVRARSLCTVDLA